MTEKMAYTKNFNLVHCLIGHDMKWRIVDGIQVRNYFRDVYELDCDWHLASQVLDFMTRTGEAEYQGNNKYLVN